MKRFFNHSGDRAWCFANIGLSAFLILNTTACFNSRIQNSRNETPRDVQKVVKSSPAPDNVLGENLEIGRPLTQKEIEIAKVFFQNRLDYSKIRVVHAKELDGDNGNSKSDVAGRVKKSEANVIRLDENNYREDFGDLLWHSEKDRKALETFGHELLHVERSRNDPLEWKKERYSKIDHDSAKMLKSSVFEDFTPETQGNMFGKIFVWTILKMKNFDNDDQKIDLRDCASLYRGKKMVEKFLAVSFKTEEDFIIIKKYDSRRFTEGFYTSNDPNRYISDYLAGRPNLTLELKWDLENFADDENISSETRSKINSYINDKKSNLALCVNMELTEDKLTIY